MTSPGTSFATTSFPLSGDPWLDALLSEYREKWGGGVGTGASLSFSFPWLEGARAWWQSPVYSADGEHEAARRFGFDAAQREAAREALQAWGEVAAIDFVEIAEGRANVGDFRFAFSSAVTDDIWGWCVYPSDYWAAAADVWVNPDVADDDWAAGSYNFMSLMHEIGHGLGLKHPGDYGDGTGGPYLPAGLDNLGLTLMSYLYPDNVYPQADLEGGTPAWLSYYVFPDTPMVLDILAVQYLYGANLTTRTGDDVYVFDPARPFYRTLWDAAGDDTLDASAYRLDCTIDLTPGAYSSLRIAPPDDASVISVTYDGTDCLGIAYGAWIENAVGGAGDDVLRGNARDNRLDGGAGNDTAVFAGNFAEYAVALGDAGELVLTDRLASRDGVDAVTRVESFAFADGVRSAAQVAAAAASSKGPADSDVVFVFRSEKTGPGINPASLGYFYTTDPGAVAYLESMPAWPWVRKASTFEAAHSNPDLAVPLYRFWSDRAQSHFYTVGETNRDWLVERSAVVGDAWDWVYEGESFRVYTSAEPTDALGKPAIPVYRLWIDDKDFDPANGLAGGHYFTADAAEYRQMATLTGVVAEGVAFYGEVLGG